MEPANAGMGSAQARNRGAAGAFIQRLGGAATSGQRATANRRAFVGGSWCTRRTEVRFLERARGAGLGHAEDRRAGCTASTFLGSAGRAFR